jgi:hypothetical protein
VLIFLVSLEDAKAPTNAVSAKGLDEEAFKAAEKAAKAAEKAAKAAEKAKVEAKKEVELEEKRAASSPSDLAMESKGVEDSGFDDGPDDVAALAVEFQLMDKYEDIVAAVQGVSARQVLQVGTFALSSVGRLVELSNLWNRLAGKGGTVGEIRRAEQQAEEVS